MMKGKLLRGSGLIAAAGAAGLAFLLAACPTQLSDLDLKQQIQGEVTVATARVLNLTIENDGNGLTTPSGALTVKEGIPLALSATAFTTHVFDHWEVISSNGPVNLSNSASASSSLTLSGGSAVVRAVFEARPRVMYSRPVGNAIALNTSVTIVFSKLIDVSQENLANIKVRKYGTTAIEGSYSSSDTDDPNIGSYTTVRFKPSSNLSLYTLYTCEVQKALKDRKGNTMTDLYTNPFQTGELTDTQPPVGGTFSINGSHVYTSGVPTQYSGTQAVILEGINADDDSGIAEVLISNEVNDAALATVFSYAPTINWNLSSGEGAKTVYMWFRDGSGNQTPGASVISKSIVLDTSGPVSGSLVIDAGADDTNLNDVALTLSASDAASGMKEMWVSNDSSFSTGTWQAYATSIAAWPLYQPSVDEAKSIFVKFRDNVDAESPVISSSIILDKTGPTATITLADGSLTTNNAAVTFALDASDRAGLNQMRVASGLTTSPTAWVAYAASLAGSLVDTEGSKSLSFEFTDSLGNVGVKAISVLLDKTAPPTRSISINGGAASTANPAATLYLSATDNSGGSGVNAMQFSNDGSTWSDWVAYASTYGWALPAPDGTKTVYARFRDAAGNVSTTASDTITLDTTPPGGGMSINSGATYATSTSVTLNISASGATQMRFSNTNPPAGVYAAYATTSPWTLTAGDGYKTVYGHLFDGTNTTLISDSIYLDTTAPSGSITILGTGDGTNYATNSQIVTLSLAASDGLSGVAYMQFSNDNVNWSGLVSYATSYSWTMSAGAGTKTVYVRYRDAAGNLSGSFSDTIIFDVTNPTATVSINAGATYATSLSATLTLSGTDASAGVWQMAYSQDNVNWTAWETYATSKALTLTATDGYRYAYFRVRDKAGNISSTASDWVYLDRVAPAGYFYIGGSANPASTTTRTVTLYLYPSDTGGAGVQYQRFWDPVAAVWTAWEAKTPTRTWTLPPINGSKTVYAQFQDYAGNISGNISDTISLASTFASITYADIAAADSLMTNAPIPVSSNPVGTLLVYKTNANRYGKMYIAFFDAGGFPQLFYNMIEFPSTVYVTPSSGTVYFNETGGSMYGGLSSSADGFYDLDAGAMTTTATGNTDFVWSNSSTSSHQIVPYNSGTKFVRWQ